LTFKIIAKSPILGDFESDRGFGSPPILGGWGASVTSYEMAQDTSDDEVEEPVEEYSEDEFGDESGDEIDRASITDDANPLNPAGDSLDRLIQVRFNEDLWTAMLGDLSCLDVTEPCVRQLQEMAVSNSTALQAIDQRVELINEKIEEAKQNNQRTINLGIFEPAIQAFLQIEQIQEQRAATGEIIQERQRRGFLDRIMMFFDNPVRGINDLLALVGVPLFRNASGGDQAAQQRGIAIADLQVKVAEIENKRGDVAQALREQVMLHVLEFDQTRREFQISQEVARRAVLRLQILDQNYRFAVGSLDTPQYLQEISAIDQQKAQTFRAWARVRSQLTRIKLLVLGEDV
jgi:hypothetical protein